MTTNPNNFVLFVNNSFVRIPFLSPSHYKTFSGFDTSVFLGFEESAILFSTLNSLEKELIKWRHNLKSIFSLVQSKIHMDSVEWRKVLGALPFIALYLLFYFVSTNSRWQQKSYIEKINRHLNANMSSMPFTLCFVRIRKTSPSFKQKNICWYRVMCIELTAHHNKHTIASPYEASACKQRTSLNPFPSEKIAVQVFTSL